MNTNIPTVPFTPYGGGFYTHDLCIDGVFHAVILAPKAEGEVRNRIWNGSYDRVEGALSFHDGRANTLAMAEAGSEFAKWALALRIGDFDDWCIPALDQAEPQYRLAKPTTEKNWCFLRSGINLHVSPATHPYTPTFPLQTENELFRAGGAEAFEPIPYWMSTQFQGHSGYAWIQDFDDGNQDTAHKGHKFAGRAVRMIKRDLPL